MIRRVLKPLYYIVCSHHGRECLTEITPESTPGTMNDNSTRQLLGYKPYFSRCYLGLLMNVMFVDYRETNSVHSNVYDCARCGEGQWVLCLLCVIDLID